ncbi:MAG: hypothetical protein U1E38_06120 [Rhodospirillales bacterium]
MSAKVALQRALKDPAPLAESLEALAAKALQTAELRVAANALEEAGALWLALGRMDRAGASLLLAASSCRLAGDAQGARRALERGLAADIPERLRDGFATEECEQALAQGQGERALECFTRLLARLSGGVEPMVEAQLLERRAAAALASKDPPKAAVDLLRAATLYSAGGALADGEAAALGAAAVLAEVDTDAAERVVSQIFTTPPIDGGAAARRGLVAGRVALRAGKPALALERLDGARQGALDCRDPISYLAAAVEGSQAAEVCGLCAVAYARLATAWGTLSDLVGHDATGELLRPALTALRERLGAAAFAEAKATYEAERQRFVQDTGQLGPETNNAGRQ